MKKGYLINHKELFKGYQVLDNIDYWYDTRQLNSILKVMNYCRKTMIQPVMYQIEFSYNLNAFNKSLFIKNVKRQWNKEWNKYNRLRKNEKKVVREIPNFHYIFSFEFKKSKPAGKRGTLGKIRLNYHHCHFIFIVDLKNNKLGIQEVINKSMDTFKHIDGINKGKNNLNGKNQNPRLNERKVVKINDTDYIENRYHNVNTEFEDAFQRASYLTKTSQKEGVPFEQSFDTSVRQCKVM